MFAVVFWVVAIDILIPSGGICALLRARPLRRSASQQVGAAVADAAVRNVVTSWSRGTPLPPDVT